MIHGSTKLKHPTTTLDGHRLSIYMTLSVPQRIIVLNEAPLTLSFTRVIINYFNLAQPPSFVNTLNTNHVCIHKTYTSSPPTQSLILSLRDDDESNKSRTKILLLRKFTSLNYSLPSGAPGGFGNSLKSPSCRASTASSLSCNGFKKTSRSNVRYPGGSSL